MRNDQQTTFSNFKGMNRQSDIANMDSQYLYDNLNGYLDKSDSIKKRFGYGKYYDVAAGSTVDINNVFEAIYDDGSSDIFATIPTKILRWNAGTWQEIKTGLTSTTYIHISQYGDKVRFSNGADTDQLFTKGGSSTTAATMPSGVTAFVFTHIHQNRMFAIASDDAYTVFYSKLGDIEDWSTAGDAGAGYLSMQANISKGDELVSIASFSKGYLAFFMNQHVFVYNIATVASEFSIAQAIFGTGTKSARSVIAFGNDLFYLDTDEIKSLRSAITNEELTISDPTKHIMGDYYRELMASASGNRLSISKYKRRSWILVHIPIGTGGEILIWDYAFNVWTGRWRTFDKINMIIETALGEILFASTDYLYSFDETVLTDDGETVEWVCMTPFYWGVNPTAYEKLSHVEMMTETETSGTEVEFSVYFEYENEASTYEVVALSSNVSLWDEALWDEALWDSTGKDISRIPCTGRGKTKRLVFRNAQNNKDVTLKMWRIYQKTLSYI